MQKGDKISLRKFNAIEMIQDYPLVYVHHSGIGMFNEAATRILKYTGVKDGDRIKLYLDLQMQAEGMQHTRKDRIVTLIYFEDRFRFKAPNIVKDLSVVQHNEYFHQKFYCMAFNPEYSDTTFGGFEITRWELYNISKLTAEIKFKSLLHKDKMRVRYEKIRAELFKILQFTQEDYNEFLFEAGCAYLDYDMMGDEWGKNKLLNHTMFWSWWKNQYNIMDEIILNEFRDVENIEKADVVKLKKHYFSRHVQTNFKLENKLYHYLFEERVKEDKIKNS